MALDQSRDERKATYRAYQDRARALAASVNRVHDRDIVQVGVQPTVWEVPEGAFVEAVVWVPKEPEQEG